MNGKKKRARRLILVARKTKILPKSKRLVLVATEANRLLQKGRLMELKSTEAWSIASSTTDSFSYTPLKVIGSILINTSFSPAKHQ